MADYVEAFNVDAPADGDFLADGDDSIRQFKRAWQERMETLVTSVDENPLKLRDGIVGTSMILDESVTIDKLDPALNFKSIIMATVSFSETILAGAIGGGAKTVTGAEAGDLAFGCWPDGRFSVMAAVTAADTVTVALANVTAGTLILASASMQIMVVKPGRPGTLHGETLPTITHTQFRPENSLLMNYAISFSQLYTIMEEALVMYGTIAIPVGSVITGASIKVRSDGTATVVGTLYKVAAGLSTSLATFTATPGGGTQQLDETFSYTVASGDEFTFMITLDSTGSGGPEFDDAGLFWARLVVA